MESPIWLDATFVQKVLRNADKDESVKVFGISVSAATAKGENYGSDVYRVAVKLARVQDGHEIHEKKSVIVKVAPEDDTRAELTQTTGSFVTELSMMSITLPRMNEILKELDTMSLSARTLYVQYEKPTHAVIEDLATKDFQMANRQAGLDLDHSLLAIRNLGRFHAASIALKEKDPESFTNYKKGMYHKDQSYMIRDFINESGKALALETIKWPELDPRIPEKLLKLSKILYDKGIQAAVYREDDFNVLNHGDFWINNMLFRYDKQRKPVDHIFVDFQISHYGSPAVDLLYFLGTSPADDIRLHHRELLLREYHTSLSNTMSILKCVTEVPSFYKLQEILKKRFYCEVVATLTALPGVMLEKGTEWDLSAIINGNEKYENPSYQGKSYRKVMNRLLPLYDSMGLLDA